MIKIVRGPGKTLDLAVELRRVGCRAAEHDLFEARETVELAINALRAAHAMIADLQQRLSEKSLDADIWRKRSNEHCTMARSFQRLANDQTVQNRELLNIQKQLLAEAVELRRQRDNAAGELRAICAAMAGGAA
jgi:hypothetical protein